MYLFPKNKTTNSFYTIMKFKSEYSTCIQLHSCFYTFSFHNKICKNAHTRTLAHTSKPYSLDMATKFHVACILYMWQVNIQFKDVISLHYCIENCMDLIKLLFGQLKFIHSLTHSFIYSFNFVFFFCIANKLNLCFNLYSCRKF